VTIAADLSGSLLEVLRTASATPKLEYRCEPEPLTGGFWAELFTFSLANPPPGWPRELVLRLMPDPGLAHKETIVQAAVAAAGFPTPAVRAYGAPDDGLGRAFMVMDRAPGAPLLSGLTGIGAVVSATGRLRQIPDLLAASMAGLHALDPHGLGDQLNSKFGVSVTLPDRLASLHESASQYGRPDLAAAAQWFLDHPLPPAPDVVCHGDLHPFNLLADGDHLTVLDWSAALFAPRSHDVGFTSLLLGEPPLVVPAALRPLVRQVGFGLARRFVRRYQRHARVTIEPAELQWHQGVACLRALVEVAGWVHQDVIDARVGHPWLISGPALAGHLSALTHREVGAQ
jgi:aminoglycoside phosphotransferase (APT) family kinase protein